jgi:hypothetical protein
LCTACRTITPCSQIEPEICYFPRAQLIQDLPSPFEKLSRDELRQEWGKELYVGLSFAHEMDFYRAITAFKRALIFMPQDNLTRRLQIEYSIFLCYYLGQKYQDALDTYEQGKLYHVTETFPAYKELLIMLFDCYQKTDQAQKGDRIHQWLYQCDAETANRLLLSNSLQTADIENIYAFAPSHPNEDCIKAFADDYLCAKKSVQTARTLNALLPGAGYFYVGLKKTAMTSFIINALFIGATYYFIKNNNIPVGIVTASLESGWYIGGINGAGLAANEYNQHLYEVNAKEIMAQNCLFPVLMLQKSF